MLKMFMEIWKKFTIRSKDSTKQDAKTIQAYYI